MRSGWESPNELWRDVPSLAVVRNNTDRLLIEAEDLALDGLPRPVLELDLLADTESGHLHGAAGLGDQLEPLDDLGVEETQVVLIHVSYRLGRGIAVEPQVRDLILLTHSITTNKAPVGYQ